MGRAPCCDKANVKKGPWSPEEDAKLKDFIHKFGTGGNWIALPQKAGLRRCGKSCRLRWLNYLRPNIKHGEFSDEEDKLICTLYATIGSRWSIIAGQLPGRTDNDIKNYWNTKLKKKLMGMMNPSPKYNSFSNSAFQTNSLSQLYYQSLSSSTPLVSNNLQNFALSSSTMSMTRSLQEGLIDDSCSSQYNYTNYYNNMLMFGGGYNESCSSSDGKDQVKRECGDFQGSFNIHQSINDNGFDEESQKFMLHYGNSSSDPSSSSVIMSNGMIMESDPLELEQVKQVINGSNLMLNDEHKMYYY